MQAVSATCLLHKTVLPSAAAAVAIRQPRYFRHLFRSSCSQCKCTRNPRTLLSCSLFCETNVSVDVACWFLLPFVLKNQQTLLYWKKKKIKPIFISYLFVKFSFFPPIQKSSPGSIPGATRFSE